MNNQKKIPKKRKRLIRKIASEVNNCEIEDKINLLIMIAEKIGEENCHQEKGNRDKDGGTHILFDVIDDNLLCEIDKFVSLAKEKTKIDLNSDSDSDSK